MSVTRLNHSMCVSTVVKLVLKKITRIIILNIVLVHTVIVLVLISGCVSAVAT